MTGPARQSTDADLDALDQVCERLAGFGLDIHAEWVDGYLTALACGPRAVEPDAWRPAMLGDTFERTFADPQDQAAAMAPLMARLAVLRSQLDGERLDAQPDQAHLVPLLHEFEGDDAPQPGSLWAQGFLAAIDARAADWAAPPDLADEDRRWFEGALGHVRALTMPPDELARYVGAVYPGADPPPSRDDLIDQACFAVQDLRLFWADHAPRPETRRVAPQPGRNDPCPCGSGKKFKKCHGAAA